MGTVISSVDLTKVKMDVRGSKSPLNNV